MMPQRGEAPLWHHPNNWREHVSASMPRAR